MVSAVSAISMGAAEQLRSAVQKWPAAGCFGQGFQMDARRRRRDYRGDLGNGRGRACADFLALAGDLHAGAGTGCTAFGIRVRSAQRYAVTPAYAYDGVAGHVETGSNLIA